MRKAQKEEIEALCEEIIEISRKLDNYWKEGDDKYSYNKKPPDESGGF